MDVYHNLIWKLMLDEFKLGHNTVKATKHICFMEDEGVLDHNNQVIQEIWRAGKVRKV